MPSPTGNGPSAGAPRRRKRACQRCRARKQRCDYQEPACHNCAAAGVECRPVVPEAFEQHPVGYVQSLEQHAAALERTLNEQFPGSASDHLHAVRAQYLAIEPSGASPEPLRQYQWQLPQTPFMSDVNFFEELNRSGRQDTEVFVDLLGQTNSSPGDANLQVSPTLMVADAAVPQGLVNLNQPDQVPTATAASFFRTYFTCIHPQYPFLSVKDCGNWYMEWKIAPPNAPISGWPAFFVKMIFAIGSLIQSKSDNTTRYQHQDLKAEAQAEQFIITDAKSSPLVRLQAMLLSAMHALHSESTSHITHITGAIIRFASIHGFHLLSNPGDEESMLKIKTWSCAYILDRAVSGVLDIPVSLPDMYISTPLYEYAPETQYPMPWLVDCPPLDLPQVIHNNSTFAHICKIRLLQSYIMHTINNVSLGNNVTPEWQESMRLEIDNWARSEEINTHSLVNTEGYQSPLWLQLISQLSRLIICRPTRATIRSTVSDVALKASCDACTIFRALQKRRQIAQPWLVVISQFQAGVTLYYISWARSCKNMARDVDAASRDCTAVMAIFADRWRNAEHYRDCLEILARTVPSRDGGLLDLEARTELMEVTRRVEEIGIHRHVLKMLREMCAGDEDERMQV